VHARGVEICCGTPLESCSWERDERAREAFGRRKKQHGNRAEIKSSLCQRERAATETNANVESEMQIATQHQSEPTNPFYVALAKLFSAFAI
jgi:N-acetylmuramoyl-L-alanine amidase CwlA